MYDTFSRSWELARASASVLRSDRELLLFPVLSGLCTALVGAAFVLPALALRVFADGIGLGPVVFALLFGFAQYAVVVFFNCALAGAALIRLQGGDPTLADGLRAARARLGPILGYAAIAATVGALLQGLRQRGRNVGTRALGTGLGAAWAMANFLVVPLLVSRVGRDVGQRLEHEGMAQLVARHAQHRRGTGGGGRTRTLRDQVVEQHDVDVQGAVAVARAAAVATVRVLQRMQPAVERVRVQAGAQHGRGIEEIRPLVAHRGKAVHRRDAQVGEARAQRGHRLAQMPLGLEVAAEAEVGGMHRCALREAHMIADPRRPRRARPRFFSRYRDARKRRAALPLRGAG
jgi:hypothetical protein